MVNIQCNKVPAGASPPAVPKPERLQLFQTLDGLWVVQQVVSDLMEPDYFMVQLVRHEDFGREWADTKEVYSLDWAQWLVDSEATVQ